MSTHDLQAEAERQAREGLKGPQPLKTMCESCEQRFRFASPSRGGNVWTMAGARESQISGTCEMCFDGMFAEEDE